VSEGNNLRKIDFHIHTVPTISDAVFDFSLQKLSEYVTSAKIDAIAITNHDIFDISQFREISSELQIKVFPGIEINLENGHVLVIGDDDNIEDFSDKCHLVSEKINSIGDYITVEELEDVFVNLNNYIVIPHYEKKPRIQGEALEKLKKYITCGEVDSPKKFVRNIKDSSNITPVIFSDARIREGMKNFPVRQTYVDCGDISLKSIKLSLIDKNKVALTEAYGNKLFQVFSDGQMISTGLNILLGGRSTGKTYTLDKLHELNKNTKYIRQFSLVQTDDDDNFNKDFAN